MIDVEITSEELNALKTYINKDYEAMNQMLVSDCETDIALLSEEVENKSVNISYLRENIVEYLKNIKLIYSLILKKYYTNTQNYISEVYRGTNLAEVERLKNEIFIDRMLIATEDKEQAENQYSSNWNRPTCMSIVLEENVPYINLKDILEGNDSILIAPFTKIKNIFSDNERKIEKNSKVLKNYIVQLEKQELDALSSDERMGLYNYILENSYSIKRRIEECIELEKENVNNFENIRKLEQLLSKYENNEVDVEIDNEDINRINTELNELKAKSNNLFEIRKQNINFVNMWKRNIAVYMIAECKEIEKKYESLKEEEFKNEILEKEKKNTKEEIEILEPQEVSKQLVKEDELNKKVSDDLEIKKEIPNIAQKISEVKKKIEKTINISTNNEENELYIDKNSITYIAKSRAEENIETTKKLVEDINSLISKQQNHAKIAGNLGASYSALNNAFEMRKAAEKLLELLENINLKIDVYSSEKNKEIIKLKLEKVSKINLEISTLLNYLNNPKIATRNSKVTRFDEMAIIEENELKRKIAEKVREIRGEAELKKLKDDLEIIEDKGSFSKFIGIFTGQNKLDDFMIDQIEIRQNAIRKTLSKKMSLAHNYSIHELMAEIKMFINENEDDELIEDDVLDLKAIAEELKRNYVILDTKVNTIIEEKENRNLPIQNKKISKQEVIEIETYRFLNKYGYDIELNETSEPKYQDTVASEIARIIEYINSSDI